jgi:hypothetical protein
VAVEELYPVDVQTVIEGGTRQIIMTYILTAEQAQARIPRDDLILDGWWYVFTDITENHSSKTDTRDHTEAVEIRTDSKDLNKVVKLLEPTLDYQGEDGYCGLLSLDLSTVTCKAAGHKNTSYTVAATREYPHLSTNDLSLIPKTIKDGGRTLELDGVTWEVQQYTNVDYEDIPDSYRAVAKYSGKASKSVVTGYITTADYIGEVSKVVSGDTVYTVYFSGSEITPVPKTTKTPPPVTEMLTTKLPDTELITKLPATELTTKPPATELTIEMPNSEQGNKPLATNSTTYLPTSASQKSSFPVAPCLIGVVVIAVLLAGAGVYWFRLRNNVKVYKVSDGHRALAAKYRLSVKCPVIDLSPLEGKRFNVEIDKHTVKTNNSRTITIRHGNDWLDHQIAYEGNIYIIEVDFIKGELKIIY